MNGDDPDTAEAMAEAAEEGGEALVAFFRALSPAARREYEELAERDRRFGEDVAAEMRS